MAKTTVVNRIDTIYIDTENPTVSVNTTVNDAGLKHNITITIRGIPITGISGLAWNKGTANRIITILRTAERVFSRQCMRTKALRQS